MDILYKYLGRVLEGQWIKVILALESVLSLVAFVLVFFYPDFSFPWWVFWLFGFAIILTFGYANFRLFAEQESEKQSLQDRINEFEDTRADIHFRKTEDFCSAAHHASRYFSHKGKSIHKSDILYRNGLPIGVIIGARLKGWKWSDEPGELIWKITKVKLPPSFDLLETGHVSFRWKTGISFNRIEEYRPDFEAKFEVPIEITEQDPRLFAQRLRSSGSYRIVIQYHTERVDASKSKSHLLTLEGDFEKLQDEICKKWKEYEEGDKLFEGFSELAQLAECE